MPPSEDTCWSVIQRAAAGSRSSRDHFAERYAPVIRAYLTTRWQLADEDARITEAIQDVFLECLKPAGALGRADPHQGGFRAFLYGVTRHVALRHERRWARLREHQIPSDIDLDQVARAERSASQIFDRAWLEMLVLRAMNGLVTRAKSEGEGASERIEILQLRYHEGLTPREIATRKGLEPQLVYRALEQMRKEFEQELLEVLAFEQPETSRTLLKNRCIELMESLG